MKKEEIHQICFGKKYIDLKQYNNFQSVLGLKEYIVSENLCKNVTDYLISTRKFLNPFYDNNGNPILPAIYETHTKDTMIELCRQYNWYMKLICIASQHLFKDELMDVIEHVQVIFKCAYPINQRPKVFDTLWIELLRTVNYIIYRWVTDDNDKPLCERLNEFSSFVFIESLNDVIASWDKLYAAILASIRNNNHIISVIRPINGIMNHELTSSSSDEMAELIVKTFCAQILKFKQLQNSSDDTNAPTEKDEKSVDDAISDNITTKDINIGKDVWRNDDHGFDDCE